MAPRLQTLSICTGIFFFFSGLFCNDISTFLSTFKDVDLSNDTDVANFLLLFLIVI